MPELATGVEALHIWSTFERQACGIGTSHQAKHLDKEIVKIQKDEAAWPIQVGPASNRVGRKQLPIAGLDCCPLQETVAILASLFAQGQAPRSDPNAGAGAKGRGRAGFVFLDQALPVLA